MHMHFWYGLVLGAIAVYAYNMYCKSKMGS